MRKYLHIHLNNHAVDEQELHGEAIARSGRYFITKTLLEQGAPRPSNRYHRIIH